jgi:hypothetical protein
LPQSNLLEKEIRALSLKDTGPTTGLTQILARASPTEEINLATFSYKLRPIQFHHIPVKGNSGKPRFKNPTRKRVNFCMEPAFKSGSMQSQ